MLALASMPSPLPQMWTNSAEASQMIATWTPTFVTRGTFQSEGGALLIKRGVLAMAAGDASASQPNAHTMIGLLAADGSLLVLEEPSADGPNAGLSSLLGQSSMFGAAQAAIGNTTPGPLNGGFRQFVHEE